MSHHGIILHVVFGTKGRYPMLAESWRDELFAYIGGTIKEHQASLISAGGIEDHIHLLIKAHPKHAISSTVQLLKQNSSRWINEKQLVNGKFQWQKGYGVFSVSQSMVKIVKQYLAKQKEHHSTLSFKYEYLATLRKHNIEFDERYVFEEGLVG